MASPEYSVIRSHIADINRRIPIADVSSYASDLLQANLVCQAGHDNAVAGTGRGIQGNIASLTSEALGKINVSPHLFSALVAVIEKRDKEFACILRKEYQDIKQGASTDGSYGVTGVTGSRPVTQPVRKTEFDHSSSTTSERADSASLEGKNFSQKPELSDLMTHVAKKAPDKWRQVGIQLKIPLATLKTFKAKQDDPIELFIEVFDHWEKKMAVPYTWRTIISALKEVEEYKVASEIIEWLRTK